MIIIVNGEKQLILAHRSGLSQLTTQLQHSSWNCYFHNLRKKYKETEKLKIIQNIYRKLKVENNTEHFSSYLMNYRKKRKKNECNMKNKNFISSALRVIEIESQAVMSLSNQIQPDFENLCKEIIKIKGKLILMGIGKSGHIAQKISATLSSTGTSSFFIHPTEAAHGDLGMISKHDAILILSNSGETKEIIEILSALKRSAGNIFTLTNNNQSTIARAGKINLVINADEEACPLDLAPTSSTTIALVFGDALAIALLEARGFNKDDFAKSHPAGQLGKKLTILVQDLAVMNEKAPIVNQSTSLKEALKNCGKTVTLLAEMEDLGAHAKSVKLRLKEP